VDVDGDTLTVTGVSVAQHGSAARHADGTFTYPPAANYNGADSFTYSISDGHGGTATATVSLTITAVNDAPVSTDQAVATEEDTADRNAVLEGDKDVDRDTLTSTAVTPPAHDHDAGD